MNWWAKQLQSGAPSRDVMGKKVNAVERLPTRSRLDTPQPTSPPTPAAPEARCPGCGSGNYMSPPGTRAQMRCFDCGYPQVQSGTGVGATTTDGTVKKATQIKSGGYSPTTIIGRVE